ncbi:MAG: condensation domain-containing protein, partial [Chloroflexota bacterium]
DQFSTVRLVVMGGELLVKADVELYKQHFLPHCLLVNGLGPTESTVTLQYFINHQTELNRGSVPVGYPVDNTEILLLDEEGNETGFSGEMVFRSAYLALGYWQKEQATIEAFLTDPTDTRKRLYRTGDLGCYLPNGSLAFLGRRDHQVKIRGFRIELGEIEAVLNQHPNVQETVVIAHTTENKPHHLIAYVVMYQSRAELLGKEANLATLRDYLREKLPNYMIPSAFVLLDALPLTPTGKLDRKALPTPDMSHLSGTTFVTPRTTTEESMVAIWCDVLGLSQVGIDDDFFHLGGHSLLATQVISRIRVAFGVELPLRTLFVTPILSDLSAVVNVLRQEGQIDYGEPLLPVGRGEPLALSYAQERLWFLDQLVGPSTTYNMPMALQLRGQLHVEALESSLQEIVRRHESLRTIFAATDGDPIQVICATALQVSHLDLSDLKGEAQQAEVRRLYQEEAAKPFDLSQDLMLRATLICLGDNSESADKPPEPWGYYVLLLTMHHIASDGWSMGIFRREFSALYAAFSQSQPSPLTPLPIQYADFAIWQRRWLADEGMAEQLTYWKQQLADAPTLLELPTDGPRPAVQQFKGGHQALRLTPELSSALKQLAAKSDATLFMTLLAAFNVLLMRYTGQTDIVVGSPIAGRTYIELESLIGFFVNTLVLRSDLSGDISFEQLLSQVQSMTLDAFRHQDIPFEKLVSELQPERNLSHTPLFQVMFVLQNAPRNSYDLPNLQMERLHLGTQDGNVAAQFDLTLNINETSQGLRGGFNYNADLFDANTISHMVGHFQVLLQGIVDNPSQPITHLPMLTQPEYQQIVHEFNDTAVDFGVPQTIHALFERQVAHTPDAIALVFGEQQLTYAELNTRANQLAHHLLELGVQADTLVAVAMKRSLEMVISLLAVLKAGGGLCAH